MKYLITFDIPKPAEKWVVKVVSVDGGGFRDATPADLAAAGYSPSPDAKPVGAKPDGWITESQASLLRESGRLTVFVAAAQSADFSEAIYLSPPAPSPCGKCGDLDAKHSATIEAYRKDLEAATARAELLATRNATLEAECTERARQNGRDVTALESEGARADAAERTCETLRHDLTDEMNKCGESWKRAEAAEKSLAEARKALEAHERIVDVARELEQLRDWSPSAYNADVCSRAVVLMDKLRQALSTSQSPAATQAKPERKCTTCAVNLEHCPNRFKRERCNGDDGWIDWQAKPSPAKTCADMLRADACEERDDARKALEALRPALSYWLAEYENKSTSAYEQACELLATAARSALPPGEGAGALTSAAAECETCAAEGCDDRGLPSDGEPCPHRTPKPSPAAVNMPIARDCLKCAHTNCSLNDRLAPGGCSKFQNMEPKPSPAKTCETCEVPDAVCDPVLTENRALLAFVGVFDRVVFGSQLWSGCPQLRAARGSIVGYLKPPSAEPSPADGVGSEYCNFCGKGRSVVKNLIAAPDHITMMCDECIRLSWEIVTGAVGQPLPSAAERVVVERCAKVVDDLADDNSKTAGSKKGEGGFCWACAADALRGAAAAVRALSAAQEGRK